ncbi:DUF695 domain-containing protein [Dactylosporangium sucinum]|uniref:Uncharacterized protein n=1 Tax=Dactylosporangium sucinum TaxID=1424081 RepID=A0A917U5N9_9ACTN|nr:DUF695 domain-containing protein [Dactylosporangium sucinum]GGM56584.1 hypothetical protein GCM10007977_067960 [Dactylosporangium sucinum]
MGLLRRLLGREQAWVERWAVYPGEVGGHLAMYNIDLGAVEAAPVARLPRRLDVEFRYKGEGATGMPDAGELGAIHALDEVVRQALRSVKGALVGRVLSGNTGRITGYLPDGATPPPLADVPGLTPETTVTPDPGWTRVREQLTPDAWQRNIMDDNQVVQELEAHGDRLSTPRAVEFLAYFPDPERAEMAAQDLRSDGFAVTVERGDEGDFVLQAIRSDAVEPPALHEVTWKVRGVVERHDGLYDGWGCMVQTG